MFDLAKWGTGVARLCIRGGFMKTSILCSLVLAGIIMLPCQVFSASYGDIYVSLIDGDVLMNTEDTEDWVPAAGNTPLAESDRVWVADGGRAEIRLRYGAAVRLNSRTALEVMAVETEGVRFSVDAGEVYVHIEEPNGNRLEIETAAAMIRPDQRSSFRVDVDEEGETALSVIDGVVKVDRPHGYLQVAAGQRLVFRPDWNQPQLTGLKSPDAFDDWNRRRDSEQFYAGSGNSRQFLPEELGSYAADFDRNGRWVETSDYGFVWTPTVVVVGNWSPYRSGRWVWMRGNYVWIPLEPWGWAPHHYGRWAFVRSFGWCWVPPVRRQAYWGPGYVGWVHSPAAVSWVPLAPREIYYGHGSYGPYSLDVGISVRREPASRNVHLYRNVRVANAVTTVHPNTFLTGKPMTSAIQSNPFLEKRTVYAPPAIKPARATTMPRIREIRSSERPPAHLFAGKHKGNEKINIQPREKMKRPIKMDQSPRTETRPIRQPVSGGVENRSVFEASRPRPPLQTPQMPHNRKDLSPSGANRENVRPTGNRLVVKETPPTHDAAAVTQKRPPSPLPKTAPILKPTATPAAGIAPQPVQTHHKPPAAPFVANKPDVDKRGNEASERKRRGNTEKDGTQEREDRSSRGLRQEMKEGR